MGRRREITKDEANVLSGLGHKIHYYYDPAEPVGPHRKKNGDTAAEATVRRQKTPTMMTLSSQRISRNIRDARPRLGKVYDAAETILKGQKGGTISRTEMCHLIASELNLGIHNIQTAVSNLIGYKYLNAKRGGGA